MEGNIKKLPLKNKLYWTYQYHDFLRKRSLACTYLLSSYFCKLSIDL
jgi:hypothetical protein